MSDAMVFASPSICAKPKLLAKKGGELSNENAFQIPNLRTPIKKIKLRKKTYMSPLSIQHNKYQYDQHRRANTSLGGEDVSD